MVSQIDEYVMLLFGGWVCVREACKPARCIVRQFFLVTRTVAEGFFHHFYSLTFVHALKLSVPLNPCQRSAAFLGVLQLFSRMVQPHGVDPAELLTLRFVAGSAAVCCSLLLPPQ